MNKDEIKEIFELYEKQVNPEAAIIVKTLKEWYFEKEDYKSRIVKATSYIKSFEYYIPEDCKIELLHMLGDDEDETNS